MRFRLQPSHHSTQNCHPVLPSHEQLASRCHYLVLATQRCSRQRVFALTQCRCGLNDRLCSCECNDQRSHALRVLHPSRLCHGALACLNCASVSHQSTIKGVTRLPRPRCGWTSRRMLSSCGWAPSFKGTTVPRQHQHVRLAGVGLDFFQASSMKLKLSSSPNRTYLSDLSHHDVHLLQLPEIRRHLNQLKHRRDCYACRCAERACRRP